MKIKIFLKKKNKKKSCGCERYKNLSEDEKQRVIEYRKKIMRCEKIRTKLLNKLQIFSYKSKM